MHHAALSDPPVGRDVGRTQTSIQVGPVNLLGVRVMAHATLNKAEHDRRSSAGTGSITDPALLDRLLDLLPGTPAADVAIWAETQNLPDGILTRAPDGSTVTRLLDTPLTIDDVIVRESRGTLRAVQEASLFAGFARRWVSTARQTIADTAVIEAKTFGVGLLDPGGRIVVEAERPTTLRMDGWAWLLREKTYGRWLSERSRGHGQASQDQATAEASERPAG